MAGTATGPDEAGEWGVPCPVVGARKTSGRNSTGQLKLRDWMVEVRAGATKLCLAQVLALQFHPLRMFELNYLKKMKCSFVKTAVIPFPDFQFQPKFGEMHFSRVIF